MKQAALALVAAAAVWGLSAGGASACRFVVPASAEAHLALADTAFIGRVEWTRPVGPGLSETRFRVIRTLKGRPQRVRIVRQTTNTSCYFVPFKRGQRTIVLGMEQDGRLFTSTRLAPHYSLEEYERAARRPR